MTQKAMLQAVMKVAKVSEADFLREVTDLAALLGWSYVHFRPARTMTGWRTPVQGPLGAGWFDLVLVHPRRHSVLFVELKAEAGKLSPEQLAVHAIVNDAIEWAIPEGVLVRTWKPSDWPDIVAALQ
jgi:hypothetical protein